MLAHVKSPLAILEDRSQFSRDMFRAMEKEDAEISVLFADTQAPALPINLEAQIKKAVFEQLPHLKNNTKFNVQLSYHIYGG